jgi:hypothetical protein
MACEDGEDFGGGAVEGLGHRGSPSL